MQKFDISTFGLSLKKKTNNHKQTAKVDIPVQAEGVGIEKGHVWLGTNVPLLISDWKTAFVFLCNTEKTSFSSYNSTKLWKKNCFFPNHSLFCVLFVHPL